MSGWGRLKQGRKKSRTALLWLSSLPGFHAELSVQQHWGGTFARVLSAADTISRHLSSLGQHHLWSTEYNGNLEGTTMHSEVCEEGDCEQDLLNCGGTAHCERGLNYVI